MPTLTTLQIVLLYTDTKVWCEWCRLPCDTTFTYVIERGTVNPLGVYRLAYCEGCDSEAPLR